MTRLLTMFGAAAATVALAGPAAAALPVALKSDAAVHDGRVTLGDLFDGAGAVSGVVVASGLRPGANAVLDATRLQMLAGRNGLDWPNQRGLRRVIALADAGPAATSRSGGSAAQVEVLTYGRDLQTGDIVQPEDLVWAKAPAYGAASGGARDSKEMIGLAARRPLRAGALASTRDVSAPLVVKKDDLVSVTYEATGVRLVLQAKALSAAAVGQSFDAVNPASKKVIRALATGAGQAVVGPAADPIQSALQSDPQLLASIR